MFCRVVSHAFVMLLLGLATASAQEKPAEQLLEKQPEKRESRMSNRLPKVGAAVPDLKVFDEAGKPFSTGNLKRQYSVLVFGCLT